MNLIVYKRNHLSKRQSYGSLLLGQERMQNTIDYGENPLSQAGIDAGFEYWKKINIKSKK